MDLVDEPPRDRMRVEKPPAHRRTPRRGCVPILEGLEGRRVPAALLPDIAMVSATTTDSKSVTVQYDIVNAPVEQPVTFAMYRSSAPTYVPGDPLIGISQVAPPGAGPTLDASGQSATAIGAHTVTFPIAGGLPTIPADPYVVVVADPQNAIAETSKADNVASFRKYSIAVVTHGGLQPHKWNRTGPPWENQMAANLKAEGFDAVIPFNWVNDSTNAGAVMREAPRLARAIVQEAAQFPAGGPVDLYLIGHSEGAILNSQALTDMNNGGMPASLNAGYITMTMLDPHAANNGIPGQQYSVSNGLLGFIAREEIKAFQHNAQDPPPSVPSNVQDAMVFYQHTPVSQTGGSNNGIYNLWGQVPVHGTAHYFDLTHAGISHSGKFSVYDWYEYHVVPTLGNGSTYLDTVSVSGAQVPGTSTYTARGVPLPGLLRTATYDGTAAPNAKVRLYAARIDTKDVTPVGRTVSGADGSWQITTRPLHPGRYRIVVSTSIPGRDTPWARPLTVRPTSWLDHLIIPPVYVPPQN